ncbi:hypothetical protein POSPLADRAFT_1046047 [Postia placenta MAD-698-R-SB12]|uniref:Uncharacterized protein n=1 Tax=Postia placenta MAD-698-R-SB12 TaxID=670580 RepID=A0A1X6N290_9APHY|nr:hypothetical protein POSPLADRAFT_1046047 [Postia placenta MAD-698-R-SB12]OSX62586.1 hypothetical protein POSPLADRAFT_1046047 [Postia placenta MAD-698-R-SB12]
MFWLLMWFLLLLILSREGSARWDPDFFNMVLTVGDSNVSGLGRRRYDIVGMGADEYRSAKAHRTLDANTPHRPHCSQETSVARHQRLAKLLRRRPGMIHYNCRGIINPLLPHLGATIVLSAECVGTYDANSQRPATTGGISFTADVSDVVSQATSNSSPQTVDGGQLEPFTIRRHAQPDEQQNIRFAGQRSK